MESKELINTHYESTPMLGDVIARFPDLRLKDTCGVDSLRVFTGELIAWKDACVKEAVEKVDPAIRPDHYLSVEYEPRKVGSNWGLDGNLMACLKYIARAGKKYGETILRDYQKTATYFKFELQDLEEKKYVIQQAIKAMEEEIEKEKLIERS